MTLVLDEGASVDAALVPLARGDWMVTSDAADLAPRAEAAGLHIETLEV